MVKIVKSNLILRFRT